MKEGVIVYKKTDVYQSDENNILTLGNLLVGGQKGYVYLPQGIAPCIPATTYKDPFKFLWIEE